MVFSKDPSISNFCLFSSGTKDQFVINFLAECEKAADGKMLTPQQLSDIVCKTEFTFDWYKNTTLSANMRIYFRDRKLKTPIKWTDEYRQHMASKADRENREYKPLRDWMIARMKENKSTKLSEFYKLHPDAPKGADNSRSSAAGKSAAKPKPAKSTDKKTTDPTKDDPKPEADSPPDQSKGGEASKAPRKSFHADMLRRLNYPANVYFVPKEDDKTFYFAFPTAIAQDLEKYIDGPYAEYKPFTTWLLGEQQGGSKLAPEQKEKVISFFENSYGYNNFLKVKVPFEKSTYPENHEVHKEIYNYVVTKEMLDHYSMVAENQYKDNDDNTMSSEIFNAISHFATQQTQQKYMKHMKKERMAEEKKVFMDNFFDKTTPMEIEQRHAVYQKLRDAKVLDQRDYLDLVEQQIKDIQDKAGVEGNGINMQVIDRQEMEDRLTPFMAIYPGFTAGKVVTYLDERDENIKLCDQAGSIKFNRDFEANHGQTLKHYIENSAAPGIWRRFAQAYDTQLESRKVLDEQAAELKKQLEAVKNSKRIRSPSRSPSPPRGGRSVPASGQVSPPVTGRTKSPSSPGHKSSGRKSHRGSLPPSGIDPTNMVDTPRIRHQDVKFRPGRANP